MNSFLSLSRKYRPKKLEDFVGHELFVEAIKNSILSNRVYHSILLSGTRGIGKTTMARIISMSLNCLNNKNKDLTFKSVNPCLECDSCKDILSGNSIDVVEIDAASNTGVDFVKDLISNASFKPLNSFYKIFIIDEVHMLSKSAFNALLKTLEEPAETVKFIFATTELKKIPITILSRCQKFYLKNIEKNIIKERLKTILNNENFSFEESAINEIAIKAKGSMRDGLSFLDKIILNSEGKLIDVKTVQKSLDDFEVYKLIYFLYLGDYVESYKEINNLISLNIQGDLIVQEIVDNLIKINLFKNNAINEFEDENLENILKKLENIEPISIPKIIRIIQIALNSVKDIKNLSNENFLFFLISKICYGSSIPTPLEIIKMSSDENLKNFVYNTNSKIVE